VLGGELADLLLEVGGQTQDADLLLAPSLGDTQRPLGFPPGGQWPADQLAADPHGVDAGLDQLPLELGQVAVEAVAVHDLALLERYEGDAGLAEQPFCHLDVAERLGGQDGPSILNRVQWCTEPVLLVLLAEPIPST